VQAEGAAAYANQERLYNASTVVEWLKAEAHNDKKLTDLFERRLLPEFRPAFEAWKKTDPLNNPNAPAGPQLMGEYRSSKTEEAARLNDQATQVFDQGTKGRQQADEYVRATVTLATVLLLIAISQRFTTRGVRVALLVIAAFLLCFPVYHILTFPRA
jgi:flagellar motor protein MotB